MTDKKHCSNCGFGKPTFLGSAGYGVDCSSRGCVELLEKINPENDFLKTFDELGYVSICKGEALVKDFNCDYWKPKGVLMRIKELFS